MSLKRSPIRKEPGGAALGHGAGSFPAMRERIVRYRRAAAPERDPSIGCRILTQSFFWPRELWFSVPTSWAPNIVSGKGFSTDEADGRYLWDAVFDRMADPAAVVAAAPEPAPRYGVPSLIKPRLGQGAFRLAVTDSYDRRCAVSGE